jgi:hypothetical protein
MLLKTQNIKKEYYFVLIKMHLHHKSNIQTLETHYVKFKQNSTTTLVYANISMFDIQNLLC